MDTLVYDIEVAGLPWDEVDPETQAYLLRKARDERARAAVPERLALVPGLGKVIAIGIWNVTRDTGLLLLEGETAEEIDDPDVERSRRVRGSETELLERFWAEITPGRPRLVTYNGRGFDGPVVMVRSAQAGLVCTRDLVAHYSEREQHTDLMNILGFHGARRENYTLDYWCRRFGVESPKTGLTGAGVGQAYLDGRIEEIGAYCLRDVRATAELYTKLGSTLLQAFPGAAE